MLDPARVAARGRHDREDPIRVLHLIKGLGPGGAEKLLCLVADARDRSGFAYEAAYLLPWKDALAGDLVRSSVPVSCLEGGKEWDLRWTVRLWRRLASQPVDILHVHSPYVAGFARIVVRLLPRRARPRVVYTEHLPWSGYVGPTRWLNRLTFGLNDATILVSDGVREGLPPRSRGRARVIVHGVPLEQIGRLRADRDAMRRELGVGSDEILVGTIANLRRQKRYPDLLRAARRVLDTDLPVRFVAAGQGPCETELRQLHAELGLGDRFRLLGYVPEPGRTLAACDLFVLASGYEGLPVALMEAMAIGLPIVATDIPGVRESVQHGREALLVPVGHPELLAEAVIEVTGDPDRRTSMARASQERSRSFDLRRSTREIEDIYRALVGPRRRRSAVT